MITYAKYILQHRVIQHLIFWIAIVLYFTLGYGMPGRYGETISRVLLFLPGHIFLTYIFFYALLPRFLYRRKYLYFVLTGILVYVISLMYGYVINFYVLEKFQLRSIWVGSPLIAQTTMLGAALSIKFLKQWYKEKKHTMEVEQQKTQAELALLKSQIHPHFLFNTLNNLYGYSIENSPKAPEIVLKLSELLRFMIYESHATFISLDKEIKLLRLYIDLEQLRYGSRLDVSFKVSGETRNKVIAPLLLIPLLENAFKHGTSEQIEQCWISLNLNVTGDDLYFKLINSKNETKVTDTNYKGGIGQMNVMKRLKLLYPDQFSFSIADLNDSYVVNLNLKLLELIDRGSSTGVEEIKSIPSNA